MADDAPTQDLSEETRPGEDQPEQLSDTPAASTVAASEEDVVEFTIERIEPVLKVSHIRA